jgi:hypothetical protein
MSGSFTHKALDVTFTLARAKFNGGGNTAKFSGLRVNATITNQGGYQYGALDLHIFGLTPSVINSLSVPLGTPLSANIGNSVLVEAGTFGGSMSAAFKGTIMGAFIETANAPDVYFHVTAFGGFDAGMQTAQPTSLPGGQDVAKIMSALAQRAGLDFENSNVKVQIASPYLWGTPRQQIIQLADAAGIDWHIEHDTLVIVPRNAARTGDVVLISSDTGMIGYPRRTATGVDFTTLYNPAVKLNGKVKIQTKPVTTLGGQTTGLLNLGDGTWRVSSLNHYLSAEQPDGPWFTSCSCFDLPGATAPAAPGGRLGSV